MGMFSRKKRKCGSSTTTTTMTKKTGKTSSWCSSVCNKIRRSINLKTGKVRTSKVK